MRSRDRRIHGHGPVDESCRVGLGGEGILDGIPGVIGGQAAMPGPHGLPLAEALGKVAPGDPGPVPVDDAFDHLPGVGERATSFARWCRQKARDAVPLVIGEELES